MGIKQENSTSAMSVQTSQRRDDPNYNNITMHNQNGINLGGETHKGLEDVKESKLLLGMNNLNPLGQNASEEDWIDEGEESFIIDYSKIQDIIKLPKSLVTIPSKQELRKSTGSDLLRLLNVALNDELLSKAFESYPTHIDSAETQSPPMLSLMKKDTL